jgi:hypothetical protein
MVQALTPGIMRGCSWVLLSVAFSVLSPIAVLAQDDAPKAAAKKGEAAKDAPKKDADKDAPAADDEDVGVVDPKDMKKQESIEVFKDPRVVKTLPNTFKETSAPNPRLRDPDFSLLRQMAANQAAVDVGLIKRMVDQMAADMTDHKNIKAVIDPPPVWRPNDPQMRSPQMRTIERASQSLIELLNIARQAKNDGFLSQYVPTLFEKLTPLLQNHYIPRLQAAIVLGLAATPATIDVFTQQLANPNQVVWIKLWAARGLTNATNGGKITLDIKQATSATAALLGFLEKEPDAPWPVKIRVFEALGSIRLASSAGVGGKLDIPAVALRHLSDPKSRLDVRAWAAWALGAIPIPQGNARFNYSLETYHIGRLAAEIGEKIVNEYDTHPKDFLKRSDQARSLTGLLLYQVYPAIAGDDEIKDSGLMKVRLLGDPQLRLMKGLDEQLKGVGRSAMEMLKAGGGDVKARRDDLAAKVGELNAFLAKNRPSDVELIPGGPKYPIAPPQVAGVKASK